MEALNYKIPDVEIPLSEEKTDKICTKCGKKNVFIVYSRTEETIIDETKKYVFFTKYTNTEEVCKSCNEIICIDICISDTTYPLGLWADMTDPLARPWIENVLYNLFPKLDPWYEHLIKNKSWLCVSPSQPATASR